MTGTVECRYYGRDFTAGEMALLRALIAGPAPLNRHALSKASGWLHVGTTQGRGRYDRDKLYDKPRKDVWLRPLRKDWKRTLNR